MSLPPDPAALLEQLCQAHQGKLAGQPFAVVLCGSAAERPAQPGSDVDYVVVIEDESVATLERLNAARAELEAAWSVPVSNTAVRFEAVRNLEQYLNAIDGKAAQALLEAQGAPERLRSTVPLTIPAVSAERIQVYSQQNFWTLQALVRKQVARGSFAAEGTAKLIKLCLIALKMRRQYLAPSAYTTGVVSDVSKKSPALAVVDALLAETAVLKAAEQPAADRLAALVNAVLAIGPADFRQDTQVSRRG